MFNYVVLSLQADEFEELINVEREKMNRPTVGEKHQEKYVKGLKNQLYAERKKMNTAVSEIHEKDDVKELKLNDADQVKKIED